MDIGIPPVSLPQGRMCPECARNLSPAKFSRLPEDNRCDECVENTPSKRIAERDAAEVERVAAELLDAVDMTRGAASPTLDMVISELMTNFGGSTTRGYRYFCYMWAEQLKKACEMHPGRASNLRAFEGISKLIRANDQGRREEDAAQMSEERLRAEMQIELMRVISENVADADRATLLRMLVEHQGGDLGDLLPILKKSPDVEVANAN